MKSQARSPALRYSLSMAGVVIAFVVTMLVPTLRHREGFILFFAAVFLSAWYGGRGPGLVACLIAGLLWDYFVFEPAGEFSIGADAIVPLMVFLLVAVMTGSFTTSLTQAEEHAREQHEWLQVTLSSIGDGVIATDAAGKISFMNGVAEKLTGWTGSQAHTKPIDEVFFVPTQESGGMISRVFKENATIDSPLGALLICRDGTQVPFEGNAAPIRNSDRQVIGTVLVFRGIQEREDARSKILEYQEHLRSMASELSLAEERQRRNIADGLHDRIGQTLALARIKLGSLRDRCADAALLSQLDEVTSLLKQMVAEVRSLTFDLSPPILYEFGLEAALEWLANSMQTQHDLDCTFQSKGATSPFRQQTDVLLFQAARELLTNVVKHAHARAALVSVQKNDNEVRVTIEDRGVGFDTSKNVLNAKQKEGFGLFSIRERIRHLGGTFEITSDPGHGTCVSLTLPVTT
jgi:PAS domain S-box-containing protein